MAGKLFVVATPIGNLGDISARAAAVLESADFIAAEDTRVTAKLLNHLGIKKPLVSYYQHNMAERGEEIIERIINGESCAQCSDAGTPAISDPGEMLVRQAIDAGIDVEPIPGACAAITALCASGLATGRFCFEGFISVSKKSRREHLNEIKDEKRTMIFYEAPHKLRNTLRDLLETLGDREITLARELTKLHEDICKTTLSAANDEYILREPRGEYVIVVEGRSIQERTEEVTLDAAVEMVKGLISGGMSTNEASKQVSALTGFRKSELYSASLDI
ncbi:MAG: 16S rRNA (cytidine(1402)-2'-O)-methyltransferase [Oscillospiraceae bacterium]